MPPIKFNWELLSITRFMLAFIVMAVHLSSIDHTHFLTWASYFGGFESVLGFLLISGFSIGKSISKNKESYFKRRIARIYPVYLASLATALMLTFSGLNLSILPILGLNLIFAMQIFTINSFGLPTWTLALEVWLYAIAPLLLKLSYKQLNLIIYSSFLLYCVYTCGRTLYHWPYYFGTLYGINFFILAYVWIAGFALAKYPEKNRFNTFTVAFIFAGHIALSFAIAAAYSYKHHVMGQFFRHDIFLFAAKAICLAWVLTVVLYNHKFKAFSNKVNRAFNLLGNISYPLYLVHIVIFKAFEKYNYTFGPVMVIAALIYSWLLYLIFDFYSKKRTIESVKIVPAV
jgi:peptidoglycan/LPS O-acetylase OafA/YrhL